MRVIKADCTPAEALTDGINAEYPLADREYGANRALASGIRDATASAIAAVINLAAPGSTALLWAAGIVALDAGPGARHPDTSGKADHPTITRITSLC